VPVSRRRKKKSPTAVATSATRQKRTGPPPPSPPWYGGLILAMFVLGIVWLLVYYLSNGGVLGLESLGGFNLLIGFGFVVFGLGLATRWR
jgi:hypothetical protein